ncbi:MAG: hypothetical protein M3N52_13840, partial [Actinomycetota bacterium]|nr:hypothetical protein [Actinomycetota bacterium]
ITILGIQDAAVLSALPAAIGAIPMATTFWQARRKATERAGAQDGAGGPVQSSQRPAETAGAVTGAIATLIVAGFGIQDAAVISALPAAIGAVPIAITSIADPRERAARLETEVRMLRELIALLHEERSRETELLRTLLQGSEGRRILAPGAPTAARS